MRRMKELRKAKNISQQRLAMELNVSQTMISKYELGQAEPDIQMIQKLAAFFHVTADYLLEISDDPQPISSASLSKDEKQVLFDYKRLNQTQKLCLSAYLKGLLQE